MRQNPPYLIVNTTPLLCSFIFESKARLHSSEEEATATLPFCQSSSEEKSNGEGEEEGFLAEYFGFFVMYGGGGGRDDLLLSSVPETDEFEFDVQFQPYEITPPRIPTFNSLSAAQFALLSELSNVGGDHSHRKAMDYQKLRPSKPETPKLRQSRTVTTTTTTLWSAPELQPRCRLFPLGFFRRQPELEMKGIKTRQRKRNQSIPIVMMSGGGGRKPPSWRLLRSLSCTTGMDVVV